MAVMVSVNDENFNNDNTGQFVLLHPESAQNSPELLLKFFPLTYHHSHFLGFHL